MVDREVGIGKMGGGCEEVGREGGGKVLGSWGGTWEWGCERMGWGGVSRRDLVL